MSRLGDSFYSDNELELLKVEDLRHKSVFNGRVEGSLVKYGIYSSAGFTGKCMVLLSDDVDQTSLYLAEEWGTEGIKFKAEVLSCEWDNIKLEALYTLIEKYRYSTKFPRLLGADRVYESDWKLW